MGEIYRHKDYFQATLPMDVYIQEEFPIDLYPGRAQIELGATSEVENIRQHKLGQLAIENSHLL